MNQWIIYALTAPALWGLSNVFDSALRKHHIKSEVALMWLAAISRFPFVLVFFWIGGFEVPQLSTLLWMLLGGALWTLPLVFYYKAMEFEEPSRVALLAQMIPIFTLLIAYFALGERLFFSQGIAFALLIAGGIFAAMKHSERKWHMSKAFLLMLIASFLWASSDVLFKKFEVSFNHFVSAFAIYFFGSFLVSLFILFHKDGRQKILSHFRGLPARAWGMVGVTQIAGIGGSIVFAYALTLGKASLTSVLIGIMPLMALVFGLLLAPWISEVHKEDVSKKTLLLKGASFALIIIGLVFLEF